jgi:hypothetical protein
MTSGLTPLTQSYTLTIESQPQVSVPADMNTTVPMDADSLP